LLVYFLIRELSRSISKESGNLCALLGALLFAVHPLQSQPVNYISQRAVLLVSGFYISAVLFYIKYRLGDGKRYYLFSILSMMLSIFSKEPSITLPLMLVMIEFIVIKGKKRAKENLRLMPFLLPLVAIPILTTIRRINWGVGITIVEADILQAGIGVWEYFFTELSVLKTYLRFFILPLGQHFDWDYPLYKGFFYPEVILSAILHVFVILTAIYLAKKRRGGLFPVGVFWFYIASLAESSFFPIFDVIFEHRVYLPMVGLALSTSSVVLALSKRSEVFIWVFVVIIILFSALTIKRNLIWRTERTLWEDSLRYSPNKERVRHMLGLAYKKEGEFEEAAKEFEKALQIGGKLCIRSKYELSEAYFLAGRYEDSIKEAKNVLSLIYEEVGLPLDGSKIEGEVFKGTPSQTFTINRFELWSIHANLGFALLEASKYEEALGEFKKSLYLKPDYVSAKNGIALSYMEMSRYEDSARVFEEILREHPDFALAHESLGLIYLDKLPDKTKALYHFQELLKKIPMHPERAWIEKQISILRQNTQY